MHTHKNSPSNVAANHTTLFQQAFQLHQQGQLEQAEALYRQIQPAHPHYADALHLSGVIAKQRGDNQTAIDLISHALQLKPDNAAAHSNIALAFQALQRFTEALASYDCALAIEPDYAAALFNRGITLQCIGRLEDALKSYNHALTIEPNNAEVIFNRGIALQELQRPDDALASYDRAIAVQSDYAEAFYNRANVLLGCKRYDEADNSYQRALHIKPDLDCLFGDWLHAKMITCDWQQFDDTLKTLIHRLEHNKVLSSPFPVLAASSSIVLQKKVTEIYSAKKFPSAFLLPALPKHHHQKIKLAYFSSDFRQHPVSYLAAELIERHDRSQFEVIAFSFHATDVKDTMRLRLEAAFDQFHDVSQHSDQQIADLARQLEIDIAIDLNGYTEGCRTHIFALRVAPVQVSYLGYLGTMGAEYMDYLIADSTLIPTEQQAHYREKIVYLPHSFQVNDSKLAIADKKFTRAELGLPAQGVVFCCFNNNYKITPMVFDSWMRILQQVDGSVLWLLADNASAAKNLQQAASARGINPERLCFAERVPMADYLARQRVADLFLDTAPYNAGATASAALWAGLPVLTCLGDTFAGRMGASLLNAIGLPELITSTAEDYEALAIQLATHPEQLAALKHKLAANRLTCPLFDTALFTQHIESAYQLMYNRYQADLPPEHIYVQSDTATSQKTPADPVDLISKQVTGQSTDNNTAVDELINQGNHLEDLGQLEAAQARYEQALAINPNYARAHSNLGNVLQSLSRFIDAIACYDHALAIRPDYAEALYNKGNALQALQRNDEALAHYEQALAIKPDFTLALIARSAALQNLKHYDDALISYSRALAVAPDHEYLFGDWLYTKIIMCDWQGFADHLNTLTRGIEQGKKIALPFPVMALSSSAAIQKKAMCDYSEAAYPSAFLPPKLTKHPHQKIKIGYFSADFNHHATAYLIAELFECHDKSRFEIFAFSFSPINHKDKDALQLRLENAFDRFMEVSQQSDEQIVRLARQLEIDIAVDLKGFTECSRPNIFAMRAAPIQVNYLGYPCTMGADYIDYLLADSVLIPSEYQAYYSEKIAYLPHSYQVNDTKRVISERLFTRAEVGLPEQGFVFYCFNGNYKITPTVFDSWMRILHKVEGSVLWLLKDNDSVVNNLRREAEARGINADRLIFAPRMPLSEHLARQRLADLFLDTLPCNAHTTTSDALWAGLPVLTCVGETFASRVAASLLTAIGLPELITATLNDYEALAIQLATHPEQLAALKHKLAANRLTCPLFDTALFTQHIESAYQLMFDRYQADLAPEHIYVQADSVQPQQTPELQTLTDISSNADADTLYNEGNTLLNQQQFTEAVSCYDAALAIQPNHAEALSNRGIALQYLGRLEQALDSYDRAIAIKPDYIDALYNRGTVLRAVNRFEQALSSYQQVLAINPDYEFLFGTWLYMKMTLCEWDDFAVHQQQLIERISQGKKAAIPFFAQVISNSPQVQKQAADIYTQVKYPSQLAQPPLVKHTHPKIKVGYFSADFRQHPVATLTAELFEYCDGERFEMIAFSFHAASQKDAMRLQLETVFDQFIDVSKQSDEQVVQLARQLEIDIAVDLNGFTDGCRPNLFALRVAPVQVSYLGYLGTMGAEYMDYLIADSTLIPSEQQAHYREKIVYLPHSFQVNDSKLAIADKKFTRAELGLPAQGVVFCCFNNNYKITPMVFDSWMRILQQVDGSVLWLLADNASAAKNLQQAASARGINPERLCFAERVPMADYLARQRVADLFLDTAPYNAGATASAALWAGLPVLTCLGDTFAGRMGASLLNAIGLPELITTSTADYETLAIMLATHPKQLDALKRKLAAHRLTHPLFDTALFSQHLEAAYQAMFARAQAGLAPAHIYVAAEPMSSRPPLVNTPPKPAKSLVLFAKIAQAGISAFTRRRKDPAVETQQPDLLFTQAQANTFAHAQCLQQQGQLAAAEILYNQLLKTQPQHPELLRCVAALEKLRPQATPQPPINNAEQTVTHFNHAVECQNVHRLQDALDSYERVLAIDPYHVDALINRGNVLEDLNRFNDALASYDRAIAAQPANARAHSNRGNVLQSLQRFDEALLSYDRALSVRPDYAEAFYNRGNALQACKRPREAMLSYEYALAIKPDFVHALIGLGNALHDERRFDEALSRYERALLIQPDHAEALYNRGNVLHDLTRYSDAIDSYNRALAIKPDDAGAHWNASFCYLILGDFANGWKNYEWRWQTDDFKKTARHFTAPQWSGNEALQGKTILLYGEQGLGDTLHFCRYAKQVAALGGRVILQVPNVLLPLLAQLEGVEQLLAQGDPLPAVDFHSPLLSLPLAFNTRLDSIPADIPYLFSQADKVQHWQAVLGAKTLPRVGVVWSGNAAQKDDYKRSLALHDLLPLLTPQCQFISLQKEVRDTDKALLAQQPLLQHYGAQLHDFTDTAALIELMDVVITVCTSVAHLSAAMGKPTWILLSDNACWRWLLNRDDNPWYPSVRLFRQTQRGDWHSVIEQVKQALNQLPTSPTENINTMAEITPSYPPASSDSADALINQGNDLEDLGRLDEALSHYDKALVMNPDYARAHSNRGNVLQLLQRFDDALASYDNALAIRPDYAEAFFNRGNALRALNRLDDALNSYNKALAIKPDFTQALVSQGNVLHDCQRPTDALRSYEQALAIQPDYVEALYNQGNVLQDCERYADALVSYDRALVIQPDYIDALYNRGNVLGDLKRYDEAIASYQRVLAMQPDYALAHWNASICYLILGDFANGWKNYEWRWQTADFKNAVRPFAAPQWSGHEALQGKTILLYGEQGLGDTLQFCRYAKQVAALGGRVILQVPKPLVCLLGNLEGVAQLLARGDTLPAVDFQSPLLSLPLAFNTRLDSIPADTAYLFSNPDKVAHWQAILGETKLPRIGLVWAGNSAHKNDHNRSLALAELLPLLTLDCQFISLQQALRDTDAALLAQQPRLQHYGAQLRDFTDTAALIELMDVVISVDTSVAHLAAAMGKPTWILLADSPDWRWLLHRADSPWYPSVRLFRQTQRGDWQPVIQQVKHALSQLPDDPNAAKTTTLSFADSVEELINQGNDLEDMGQFDSALACYDRALAMNPDYARAHSNRGNVLQLLQRFDDALNSYDRALAVRPDYAEAFFNRGNALRALHRFDEALSSYDYALAIKPEFVMALVARGGVLQDLKRFADALDCYDRALVMQPDYAEAHYNRGNVLQELKRFEDALASYDCALTINPEYVEALGNRGLTLHSLKRFDEALASYDHALIIQPNNAETLSNRGNVLRDLERYDEAFVSYDRALIIKPDHTDTLFNRGAMLRDLKRYDEAIASYERVLTIQPDHADAHHNQSLCQLLLGDFSNGWRNYEWRWQTEQMREHNRVFKQPLWQGEQSLAGKTILLYAEQGFGDTLQFCRYAQHVKALGATVLLEVPPALRTLLHSLQGVDVLLNKGEPLPDFDYHCPLLSLPLAFNTDLATIPAENRYIFSPAERVQKWQAILGDKTLPRIGLAWSGSPRHKNDYNRSIPFSQFKQLLNTNAHFYSLQKDLRDDEAALLTDCSDIQHFGDQLHDFSDTAALCELMDIIISVDTSIAHLAGAMGKRVWILLPYNPDWRWMLDREDSAWYPSTRLFRQPAPRDWQTVLDKVNGELCLYIDAPIAEQDATTLQTLSETDPDTFQHAMRLHQQGQLAEAEALYEDILKTQPQHIDALHFLGVLKNQQGQTQRAVELIRQSLALYPDNAAAHSNLALALQSLHRLDDALACYDKVLLLQPNSIDALSGRGIVLQMLHRFDEALLDYDRILTINPHHAEALFGRANVLYKLKRLDDALISYQGSLAINPDSVEALYNQGLLLVELNRIDDAISNYQRALAIKPDYAEVHNNLGSLLKKQERHAEAASSYQRAIASKPDYTEAYCNLITLLKDQGHTTDAQATINAALAAIPDSLELRFIQLIMSLPMVTHTVTEAALVPAQFDTALTDLENWLTQSPSHQHSLTTAGLLPLPFLLAYRTGNHVQRLARYGDIVAAQGNAVAVDKTRTKLKMVVVSHHFHRHSVWDVITRGLLVNIDRSRFELVLYHLGGLEDQETAFAKSLADVWRDTQTVSDVHGWLSVLADDKPDVIFYPEIGMDPMSARLAAHRLAPLQIASWGHPVTTGLPDIDLYFSGDLLEAPDADSHYRERLIRLPSTGCCTTLFKVTPEPLPELAAQLATRQGISFIIPQTVYKFDPADDGLYADIARVTGNCTFILLRSGDNAWAMDQVVKRLEQTFTDRGLHPEQHLLVIPWQSVEKFQTLLDLCDVYLDCPSFSGYTTAWQAAHRGIPIVTLEGEFMRQRLAAGLLRKIGITDTIASSRADYVRIAVKLAEECGNPIVRNARRQLLKTAAPKADNDSSVVRAFEQTVIEVLAKKDS